jgi:hypothetical protein
MYMAERQNIMKKQQLRESTIGLPRSLYARVKIYCNDNGLKIKAWVAKVVENALQPKGE